MIETAETYFSKINRPKARKRLKNRSLELNREVSDKKLRAKINHSRWIVLCPHCNNAELLFSDKRFFCTECRNEMIGGKLYRVIMPRNKLQIETLLESRPVPNCNWQYPETIEDLANENKIHIEEMD